VGALGENEGGPEAVPEGEGGAVVAGEALPETVPGTGVGEKGAVGEGRAVGEGDAAPEDEPRAVILPVGDALAAAEADGASAVAVASAAEGEAAAELVGGAGE